MESILDVQQAIYSSSGRISGTKRRRLVGPPMLPHGDDPKAVLPPPPHKRRRRTYRTESSSSPLPTAATSKEEHQQVLFPASSLPAGFPPQLAYRALAAYSLLRTLSIPLRLSPFAPAAFLRALSLPVPNRLAGQLHVALLRVLLRNLKMGYHWGRHNNQGEHNNNTGNHHHHNPSVDVVKKRKVDGLRWPLRAGDNLQILDAFTWPVFFDDYCHLSADSLYASLHDESLHIDYDNMDVSHISIPDYQDDNRSRTKNGSAAHNNGSLLSSDSLSRKANSRIVLQQEQQSVIYTQEPDRESDEEWVAEGNSVEEEDDDDDFLEDDEFTPKRKKLSRDNVENTAKPLQQMTMYSENPSASRVHAPKNNRKVSQFYSQLSHGHLLPGVGPAPSGRVPSRPPTHIAASSVTSTYSARTIPAASEFPNHVPFSNGVPPPSAMIKNNSFGLMNSAPSTTAVPTTPQRLPDNTPRVLSFQLPSNDGGTMVLSPNHNTATILDHPLLPPPPPAAPTMQSILSMHHQSERNKTTRGFMVNSSSTHTTSRAAQPINEKQTLAADVLHDAYACAADAVPSLQALPSLSEASQSSNMNAGLTTNALANQSSTTPHLAATCFPLSIRSNVPTRRTEEATLVTGQVATTTARHGLKFAQTTAPATRLSTEAAAFSKPGHDPKQPFAGLAAAPRLRDSVLAESSEANGDADNYVEERLSQHTHEYDRRDQNAIVEPAIWRNGSGCTESPFSAQTVANSSIGIAVELKKSDSPRLVGGEKHTAASFLRAFVRGGQCSSHPGEEVNGADSRGSKHPSSSSSVSSSSLDDEEADLSQWPQFRALESMRTGIPYHHLNLAEKLDILEFLIDELLTVDEISLELTRRRSRTSYASLPFARLPSLSDYESMENEDWCSVCRKEGELLCCDGCVASYHRKCVGLPLTGGLPEGQWFCPECTLVDPALFGPLLGGRKPCIEWASVRTLDRCSRYETSNGIIGIGVESPSHVAPVTLDDWSDMKAKAEPATPVLPNEAEYLCVHGFVFWRSLQDPSHSPLVPLLPDNLERHLVAIGPAVSSSWPLAQIPINQSGLRDVLALRSSAGYRYTRLDHFNPLLYENLYAAAPLPSVMGKRHDALEYESRCGPAIAHQRLSACLRVDVSNDEIISKSLRTSFHLFNPYHMFSNYLLDLESRLSRASLLHETWEAREAKSRAAIWRKRVKSCRSSDCIARLMVSLVDAVHVRAFDDHWFACTRAKPAYQAERAETIHLTGDVDIDLVCRTRLWRTCPISSLPSLLSRENSSVADWISDCRPDFARPSRKHKRKRGIDVASEDGHGVTENEQVAPFVIEESPGRAVSLKDSGELLPARKKLRRSHDARSITDNVAADACERYRKMKEVVEATTSPFVPEVRWPVAGRKLFPPVGSLPSHIARRHGRKGGASIVPFLSYIPGFEVGQAAVCHVWRQNVVSCRNFEELLVCMRILESHLSTSTIRKCTTLTHRYSAAKQHPNSQILCSEIDLRNGLDHYLVQKPKHTTATWIPSTEVDLGPLVARQLKRYNARCSRTKQKTQVENEHVNGSIWNGMIAGSVHTRKVPVPSVTQRACRDDSNRPLAASSVAPRQHPSSSHVPDAPKNSGIHLHSLLNAQVNRIGDEAAPSTDYGPDCYPQSSGGLPFFACDSMNSLTPFTIPPNPAFSSDSSAHGIARMFTSQQTENPLTDAALTYQNFSNGHIRENTTSTMPQGPSRFATNGGNYSSGGGVVAMGVPNPRSSAGHLQSALPLVGDQSHLHNSYPWLESLVWRGTMLPSCAEPRNVSGTESFQMALAGGRMHANNGQVPLFVRPQSGSLEHGHSGFTPTIGFQTPNLPYLPSSQWPALGLEQQVQAANPALSSLLLQLNGNDTAQTTSIQSGYGMSHASPQDLHFSSQGYVQSYHQPQTYNQIQRPPPGSNEQNQQSHWSPQPGQYQESHATGYGANPYYK